MTLNILQWNAQGINGHGDELRLHINNRQEIIHLICVQETWLLENEHFDINNYEGVYRNRKTGIRGYDEISAKIVKSSINAIVSPLCNIFNSSLEKGIFPNALKIAKVIPIYKNGSKNMLNNHRPISILSIFSKILEKIVYDKLTSFIEKHNILHNKQFGFRKGYSTTHALIELTDKIAKAFEKKHIVISLFLDLSKAFDCIDHSILLKKLKYYGIRGNAIQWFESYLCNRKQYVSVDNFNSEYKSISVGVPQGSNLGPLLFLLYINDLQYVSNILSVILFADDTSLFLSGKDPVALNNLFNSEMKSIQTWFTANKLYINRDKTCYMIFKSRNCRIQDNVISIELNDLSIKRETSTKFLGVIIDENLNWKEHVNYIALKISKSIGVFNILKHILPLKILTNLYNCMILSHFMYSNIVWGGCSFYLSQQLFLLQKRAIRAITKSNYLAHTQQLFKKLKILNIFDINKLQLAAFMFSYSKQLLPNNFHDYFEYNCNINKYKTRNSNKMYVPFYIFNFSRTTVSFKGPQLSNELPNVLKEISTVFTFRKKYKCYLLNCE